MKRLMQLLKTALLALTLSVPALSFAEVPKPVIPEAVKGEECVEPTDVMRRKHMDYLMAHRDDTMHKGIRTTKYSLNQCIECHAEPEESQDASAGGEQGHFCANCHNYAGVNIDCFQCHVTRPEKSAMFHPLVTPGMKKAQAAHRPAGDLLNSLAGVEQNTTGGVAQ